MSEIEKAIKRLESTKDFLREEYQISKSNLRFAEMLPELKATYNDNKKGFDLAIQFLQEKQERDKGCEYCKKAKESGLVFNKHIDSFAFLGGNTQADGVNIIAIPLCPMCGRKLVEK